MNADGASCRKQSWSEKLIPNLVESEFFSGEGIAAGADD